MVLLVLVVVVLIDEVLLIIIVLLVVVLLVLIVVLLWWWWCRYDVRRPEHPDPRFLVDDGARRGDRQPVLPLAGEDPRAFHKYPRHRSMPRVVPTRRLDRDNRQAALCGLKAQISPVKVEAERGIKPERRVSGNDQQQFVQGAHSRW